MRNMLTIDGSFGEGGGQVLRTALGLSVITGRPFRIEKIRAGRSRGGLLRQHLTAVNAASAISCASVNGNAIGSTELTFVPKKVVPGDYSFSVGTAGSATLVLQTILPALVVAGGVSTLRLEGGTHNPYAPPFDFLQKAFMPCLHRMGANVQCTLERYGFYPAGGGVMLVRIDPCKGLSPIAFNERGAMLNKKATALLARLPGEIGRRELAAFAALTGFDSDCLKIERTENSPGPGNALIAEIESEGITEVFTGFGERGIPADKVAAGVAREVLRYINSGVPIGAHLADQLVLLMSIAGGGTFRTLAPTEHTRTNIEVIKKFLDLEITVDEEGPDVWCVSVAS